MGVETKAKVAVAVAALVLAAISLSLLRGIFDSAAEPMRVAPADHRIAQITKDNLHQFRKPEHAGIAATHSRTPARRPADEEGGPKPTASTISSIDRSSGPALDRAWLPLLRTAPIVAVQQLSSGLSEKWRGELEGGFKAAVKPAEDPLYVVNGTEWATIDFYEMQKRYGTRTGRMDQGMGEIAGYHLDRVLGFYRKPPVAGRLVSSKVLFGLAAHDNRTRALAAGPEFFVPVAMIAWMDSIEYWLPPAHFGQILRHEKHLPSNEREVKRLREVSDAIIFDFLSDDHDRRRNGGNWIVDAQDTLLLWDSGIAWLHGPEGRQDGSCSGILCGPDSFIDGAADMDENQKVVRCNRTTRFSRPFVHQLREIVLKHESLGEKLIRSMAKDDLAPAFERYAKFYWRSGSRKKQRPVHFKEENFARGMDEKVNQFLQHVEKCEQQYGHVLF